MKILVPTMTLKEVGAPVWLHWMPAGVAQARHRMGLLCSCAQCGKRIDTAFLLVHFEGRRANLCYHGGCVPEEERTRATGGER